MGTNTMVSTVDNTAKDSNAAPKNTNDLRSNCVDSKSSNKLGLVKSELIEILATKNPFIRSQDVSEGVDIILTKISTALAEDDKTEIRGFGSFRLRRYASRTSRNPRTGEEFVKQNSFRIYFRASSVFHDSLNPIENYSKARVKTEKNSSVNKGIVKAKSIPESNGVSVKRNMSRDSEIGVQPIEHERQKKIA